MNILEKFVLIGIVLLLIGSSFIIGMLKGRDMCVSYAQKLACDERIECPKCEEFDLSYCPECTQEIITEPCLIEPDPMEVSYFELEEQLKKAMLLIETQQAIIDVMNKLKGVE